MYGQILCVCLHTNGGREDKNKKDSVCLYTSQYSELFSVEKSFALYMGKYGKYFHILHSCFFSGV